MHTFIQKSLYSVVSLMTVLSMSSVAAFVPAVAHAATLESCDDVEAFSFVRRADQNSTYFVDADFNRVPVPYGFVWESFGKPEVDVLPAGTDLEVCLPSRTSLPLFVDPRPGCYGITTPATDNVYVHGAYGRYLLADEAAAKFFLGGDDNWGSRARDVADIVFSNSPQQGEVEAGDFIPGTFATIDDSGDVFFVDMDEDGFAVLTQIDADAADLSCVVNGYTEDDLFDFSDDFLSMDEAYDQGLANFLEEGGSSPAPAPGPAPSEPSEPSSPSEPSAPVVPLTGEVTVGLAADTNFESTIPSGAFYAPIMCVNVSNGTNQEVKFSGAKIQRFGILSDSDIQGILITDGKGILHGNLVTFGQSVAQPGFYSDAIRIPAGQSDQVCVNVNIKSAASTGTFGVMINGADDFMLKDSNGNEVLPQGQFPLKSQSFGIVTGTGSLGTLDLSTRTIIGGTSVAPIEIDQGTADIDVAKFRFQEVSGNEDVELCNFEIQNNGSASAGDYFNIRVVDQNNTVVAQADSVVNNIAKFALRGNAEDGTLHESSKTGCYYIKNGQLRDFTIRVDTATHTNSAGRTLNFTLQNDFRVRAVGMETNSGVNITATSPQTFPIGDADAGQNHASFRAGSASLSRATASISGKIAQGATNLTLGEIDVRAFGEDIELQEIGFVVLDQNGTALAQNRKSLNGTVRIHNENDQSIFSITATDSRVYGSNTFTISNNNMPAGVDGLGTQHTLSSFYRIPVNHTGKLKFVVDIDQNATSADSYKVRVTSLKFRKESSNTFTTLGSATTGNLAEGNGLTVEDATLGITQATAFNPVNIVRGGALQKIGSFSLQAGASEDMKVNALKVRACTRNGGTVAIADCTGANPTANVQHITSVTVADAEGKALAPSQNLTGTGGVTFSTQFVVPANQSRVVDVWAVVSTAFGGTTLADRFAMTLEITSVTAQKSQTAISVAEVLGQQLVTQNAGTISSSFLEDGNVNVSKIFHAGETDVPLFKFKSRQPENNEDLLVPKTYFWVGNGTNNIADYKVFTAVTEQGLQAALSGVSPEVLSQIPPDVLQGLIAQLLADGQVQLGSDSTLNGSEVRFSDLEKIHLPGGLSVDFPLKKGGEQISWLAGNTVTGGNMAGTDNFRAVITFTETIGQSSGVVTRYSGGYSTAFNTSSNSITVNDINNFEVNDFIFVDGNNNGLFVTDFDDTNPMNGVEINEALPYCITAVNTTSSITLGVNLVDLNVLNPLTFCQNLTAVNIVGTETAGGPLSALTFASKPHTIQEIEPVISALQVGAGNQVSENEIGTFKITNQGARSMQVNSIRFEISGSYNVNGGFAPKNFRLDRADQTTGARLANTMNNGATLGAPTLVHTQSTTTVFAGGTVDNLVLVVGDTSLDIDGGNTSTLAVGDRLSFAGNTNGGIGYRITAISAVPGATNVTVTPGIQSATIGAGTAISRVTSSPTIGATAVLEGGQVIQYDFVAASLTEEIAGGESKAYVLLADTTSIKNNTQQGTTANTQVRLLGSRGLVAANNGLTWQYTRTRDGAVAGPFTVSDSYIVSGKSLTYN